MASIGLQIRSVAVLCRAVQVVVPVNELHELLLDVCQLLSWELILVRSDFLLTQEAKEAKFVLQEEKESASTSFRAATGSTDAMNVVIWIIGRVILDHPVNFREIKTSLSHICAE